MGRRWEQATLDHRIQQANSITEAALALILEHGAPALTMAGIADAAEISRQTLYRYFPDIDAVLVGIAELVAAHDDELESLIAEHTEPAAQLDAIIGAVANAAGHDHAHSTTLRATLPPKARQILSAHENRITNLVANVLDAGIRTGAFRSDLTPAVDAPLVLGLASAADRTSVERANTLIHRIVNP